MRRGKRGLSRSTKKSLRCTLKKRSQSGPLPLLWTSVSRLFRDTFVLSKTTFLSKTWGFIVGHRKFLHKTEAFWDSASKQKKPTAKTLKKALSDKKGVMVSAQTVRNHLKHLDYKSSVPKRFRIWRKHRSANESNGARSIKILTGLKSGFQTRLTSKSTRPSPLYGTAEAKDRLSQKRNLRRK